MHIIGRTLVLKILLLKCSCSSPVGLSDIRSDCLIHRTIWNFSELHSLCWIAFYSSWVIFLCQIRLSNVIGLSDDTETPKFNGTWVSVRGWNSWFKNNGVSDMTSDYPIDRIVRNSPEFRSLFLACLGGKNIKLSDVTSDFPRWDEKILSQRPHFRGFYTYPPPNPFLGLPNSFHSYSLWVELDAKVLWIFELFLPLSNPSLFFAWWILVVVDLVFEGLVCVSLDLEH